MTAATNQPPLDRRAIFYMFLLAVQFGVQPILTRRFTPQGITRSTVVLMQEVLKFVIAGFMLQTSGAMRAALKGTCQRETMDSLQSSMFVIYCVSFVSDLVSRSCRLEFVVLA